VPRGTVAEEEKEEEKEEEEEEEEEEEGSREFIRYQYERNGQCAVMPMPPWTSAKQTTNSKHAMSYAKTRARQREHTSLAYHEQ